MGQLNIAAKDLIELHGLMDELNIKTVNASPHPVQNMMEFRFNDNLIVVEPSKLLQKLRELKGN